jgi:hypothetical protein
VSAPRPSGIARALARIAGVATLGLLLIVGAQPAPAGIPTLCCVCACAGLPPQCESAVSPFGCQPLFDGCAAVNGSCATDIVNGTCAQAPQCAAAGPVEPAPLLDVTGLTIAVVVLSGLAALRIRRRAAARRAG